MFRRIYNGITTQIIISDFNISFSLFNELGNEIIDVYKRMQKCDTVREQRTVLFDSFDILGYGKKCKMWESYIAIERRKRLGNMSELRHELETSRDNYGNFIFSNRMLSIALGNSNKVSHSPTIDKKLFSIVDGGNVLNELRSE